jgi:hypothetical protein
MDELLRRKELAVRERAFHSKRVLTVLGRVAAILLILSNTSFFAGEESSEQTGSRRSRVPATDSSKKYSNFLHKTHGKESEHQTARALKCNDCHTIRLATEPDRIADAKHPEIARGFPYHDACFGCHRAQVFRGDRPVICTNCHTRVSPKATAKDVYAKFPKQDDLFLRQFPGYFPHKSHRSVMILSRKTTDAGSPTPVSWIGPPMNPFSTLTRVACDACHVKDDRTPVPIAVGGNEQTFTPTAGTFRKNPAAPSAHAACFSCHWQTNEPKKDDCAGCHLTAQDFARKKHNPLSSDSTAWFKEWPTGWPKRVSLKFNHDNKDHLAENCTTCHTRIISGETLGTADVPIETCAECHLKVTSRTSISKEMFQEDDDILEGINSPTAATPGKHTCTACHTSQIGSIPPPCSHYLLFGERYLNAEDYPKSAKQIAERCKQ